MGRCTYVGMRDPRSRSGVDSVAGHSGDPRPNLGVEETDGGEGCSAGRDPYVMEEQQGWSHQGSHRGAHWFQEPDQGSIH